VTARGIGARFVRLLARAASYCYPARFRRRHGATFPDVADHLLAHESSRRPSLGAVLSTSSVIVRDTLTTSPAMWMDVIANHEDATPRDGLGRRLGHFGRGSWQDLTLAARTAIRRPVFSLLVVATLGAGIGTSTAAFDALDRAILNPLPFANSDALVLLMMRETTQQYTTSVQFPVLQEWRARATTTRQLEVFRRLNAVVQTPEGARVLSALGISGGMPGLLGVAPVRGRMFTPADAAADAPATVMLSEQYWRREYGADPGAVGRVITLAGKPTEIIGVWPGGARLDFQRAPDLVRVLPAGAEYSQGSWVQVLARRQPGRTTADLVRELAALTPPTRPGSTLQYRPQAVAPADILLGDQFVSGVWLVFAGGLVLLAAAIANAAHLLLERANARGHELGVRLALGGSQARLVRLFFAEGLVYAAGAIVAGSLVAFGLERLIAEYEPRLFREATGAGLGGRAFTFAAAAAVLSALACTLAPVLRLERRGLTAAVSHGHGRATAQRSRAMQVLVGIQAGLAVLLVFGAALMGRSMINLLAVDPGIDTDRLVELSISLPAAAYPTDDARALYLSRALEALQAMPGAAGVVTSGMPILNASLTNGKPRLEGEPEPQVPPDATTATDYVPAHYARVMGLGVRAGRMFDDTETGVAVVSERFAAPRGGAAVIGRRLFLPRSTTPLVIVGVVNDVRYMGLGNDADTQPAVYISEATIPRRGTDAYQRFIIRTDVDPAETLATARRRLAEIDPTVPVLGPQTGPEVMRRQTAQHRFAAALVGGLAAMGFVLAMSGVYGAVALSVARRTREIGVRMALGASPHRLVGRFVVAGLRPVVAGAMLGAAGVWLAAPVLQTLLFRVSASDPVSGGVGLGLVLATAAMAALIPARRISRVDPARTLREA
jgi:putative ABC transport system permease protein